MTVEEYYKGYVGGPMTLAFIWGEIKELIEGMAAFDKTNVIEEWHDVTLAILIYLIPITYWMEIPKWAGEPSVTKCVKRFDVWIRLFNVLELKWDKKYLRNGSNYKKSEKVFAAVNEAAIEQNKRVDGLSVNWAIICCS